MSGLDRCAWITFTFISIIVSVSGCPSNTGVFTTTGSSARLHYDAIYLPVQSTIYHLIDPQGRVRAQYGLSKTLQLQMVNVTFTSRGVLTFVLDDVQANDAGTYRMVRSTDKDTALLCDTVYIKGNLSVPTLTSNKSPAVGESVSLTCSSSSTTVPAGLPLVYTWQVDGATNPADSRYTYSTSRDTLTISSVRDSDVDKEFTCTAQEQGSKVKSVNSNKLGISTPFSDCSSNTNVFTSTGSPATIQYDAKRLPNKISVYQIKDPQGRWRAHFVLTIASPQTVNMSFTGDTSTGDLSFRIDNVQTQDTGVYKMVRLPDTGTPLLCNTVYIAGSLSVPSLTSNKTPSVGESVTLTCSSSSTTVPAGLPLVYTWQVDDATNPVQSRYMYSTSRDTLTVSDVQKSDAEKVFICRALEEGSNITSNSSIKLRITALHTILQDSSQINVGVVAASIVGALVALTMVGIGIFLIRRGNCTSKNKTNVADGLIMEESPNVYETPNQDASPDHVYTDLDRPVSNCSSGQADGLNEYEKPVSISEPEPVYTNMQET